MTLVDTPTIGLEELQRLAFYVFFKDFNSVLDQIAARWLPLDEEFDTITGRSTALESTLEHIPNSNFHEGHKPSLLLGVPENYPNLAVFANRADPSAESTRFDQALDGWSDSLLIEIMVKSPGFDPEEPKGLAEEIVNRRIQRTVEAAVILLRRNQTLGGAVTGFENVPAIAISDVFAVRTDATHGGLGPRYVWQGAQITFRITKDSVAPSSLSSVFGDDPPIDYSQFIDQG